MNYNNSNYQALYPQEDQRPNPDYQPAPQNGQAYPAPQNNQMYPGTNDQGYTQPGQAPVYQSPQDYDVAPNSDSNLQQAINPDFALGVDEENSNLDPKALTASTRIGFVRKVMGIVAAQLVITAGFIALSMYSPEIQRYQQSYASLWTLGVAFVLTMTIMYSLFCYRAIARKVPTNYILMITFTIAFAWTISFITALYDPSDVFIAAAATAGVVCGAFFYALFARVDFTYWLGGLFAVLLAWTILGFCSIWWTSKWAFILWAALGVIIFTLYIFIDLYLILGKGRGGFSIDDYIVAAMMLYIDIMRLFLEILKIVGATRN